MTFRLFNFTLDTIVIISLLLEAGFVATTPTATRAVANNSKAGLAWPNGGSVDIEQYESTGKVSWYHTWSPFTTDTDLEPVPLLWGQKSVSDFSSTIQNTISQGKVKAVLGMNEPQQEGQSNLTAQAGADMWKTYLEPLHAQGIRLGSPAPSSAPSGKIWLQDFLTACAGGCSVDFIALHWYGVNATQFIFYLQDFHDTFQRPLWITEWACQNFVDANAQCSQDDVVQFMNTTQSFMDSADFVERYAWFGAMKDLQGVNPANALMDGQGKINALGNQYIGATSLRNNGTGASDGSGGFSSNLAISLSFSTTNWINLIFVMTVIKTIYITIFF